MTAMAFIPTGLPTPRAEYRLAATGRVTGDCSACGKERFFRRKDARRAGKRVRGVHLSAYRCGEFWHYGKLDPAVIRGRMTRDNRINDEEHAAGNPTAAAQIRAIWTALRSHDPESEEGTPCASSIESDLQLPTGEIASLGPL